MNEDDVNILKACLEEALALADDHSLCLTSVRIAEAINALTIEGRQDRQGP